MNTFFNKDIKLISLVNSSYAKRTAGMAITALVMSACTTVPSQTDTGSVDVSHHALSSAVTYQTESKEYPLLSSYVYQRAAMALPTQLGQGDVVVMDVDETVLDNSQYQRERELQGLGYTSESWNAWINRKQATAVPGVSEFLESLIAKGGKVALITNRDKALDDATWENLLALGLPLTPENTCMLGRTSADKSAINGSTIINDKDLRRSQLKQGKVTCSNATSSSQSHWRIPHTIIMQIGDNIEDFEGITQESANIDELLPQVGSRLFILPNPMYGSW